jgi:hypothetical protein
MPTTKKGRPSHGVLFLTDTVIFTSHKLTVRVAYHCKVEVVMHVEGVLQDGLFIG